MNDDLWEYYDTEGQPCSEERYWELLRVKAEAREAGPNGESDPAQDPTRIGSDHIGEAWVSTVWLGMNHRFGDGPPLIFETMVFGGEYNDEQWRWSTPPEARAGHAAVVERVRESQRVAKDADG